ncbi:MAG: class I lanthipeptide [Kordia sp.]|uniref:class I lanthipeptide n=1 Tax=Kordia sp. TaxID=1965332 RepID=UPI00385CE411
MKKNKFSSKLALNKNVISNLESRNLVGGGPTWEATCGEGCISKNARYRPCPAPIKTEMCAVSEGCEPPTMENCPTLYVTC